MQRLKCPYCNKKLKLKDVEQGYEYHCPRCDSLIHRSGESPLTIVVLSISTFILFFGAVTQPLLNIKILYDTQISVLRSIQLLSQSDIFSAFILAFTIIIIPISMLLLIFSILFYQNLGISKERLKILIVAYTTIKEWNMIAIYFVGLLVSMVKMTDISEMTVLTGLWVNLLYVIFFFTTVNFFNPYDTLMIHKKQKSASKSLNRSMLYIVLALIFLVPANLLPIMPIYKYAVYYPNTLLDGVISFYNEGDYFVSGVILISSIILPFVKLFGLTFMIIMVKYNLLLSKRKFFIKYYIAINSISKYSMIDVYVVVLASSYIQYDDLIRIEVGEAFIPFTLVVFFTVLANKNFDTKLLWKEK